ncbi:sphingomyelin phosphodiesterase-like [Argiope bruennichi]|uniref:Sphingomyelin phosphodiesterase n=1 Tax=Argiope bruennichi TaxID=94029 RepID=A0A8T0FPV3_ARGBR|nr:sphingomyelin phosphodiesterase-like [Argiope bruennichi]XP_055938386.1 sphingomyelin phosphodiesterase-like [Argiope bruennichi]KAF8793227.1 Sphingomyelin phosphodiesterase like protein [Argiope bruennichi]
MNKIFLCQIFLGITFAVIISECSALPTDIKIRQKRGVMTDVLQHVHSKKDKEIDGMFFIQHLPDLIHVKEFLKNLGGKASILTKCISCRFVISFFQHYLNSGATENDIASVAYKICNFFKIETPRVCTGVTKLFKRELTEVLLQVALNPGEICSVLYQGCGTPINPLHDWKVPLPPFPKPPVNPPRPPKPTDPQLRVLHISDVHIDLNYKENTSASCGEPLCCRPTSGPPKSPSDASGYWGDYRDCDIPLRTLENMLDHINKTHKIDYVIWTGDIPPHDIWNYTRNDVIHLLHTASKVMLKYLGHVPIFPALGNHESSPVNSFPIPDVKGNDSISWLYNEIEKAWLPWVPDSSETLRLGAFYTAEVYPGLRIISLNMNYCNSLNWWLLINSTDPTGQLGWLVAQLQMAENKGEKVHIIGHIPPGEPDCLGVWSSNYNRIINRYESTVTGQFFGHTHSDEFELFFDETSHNRATSIVYIGPSVTTYDGFNPGYRIYTVDGNYPQSSRYVLDHETYFANLTEANLKMKLNWQFEYSAKEAYNMSSLFPEDWNNLTRKFQEDDFLFQKFHSYYYKMATFSTPDCDEKCKEKFICRMRRGQSNNPLFC